MDSVKHIVYRLCDVLSSAVYQFTNEYLKYHFTSHLSIYIGMI